MNIINLIIFLWVYSLFTNMYTKKYLWLRLRGRNGFRHFASPVPTSTPGLCMCQPHILVSSIEGVKAWQLQLWQIWQFHTRVFTESSYGIVSYQSRPRVDVMRGDLIEPTYGKVWSKPLLRSGNRTPSQILTKSRTVVRSKQINNRSGEGGLNRT